MTVTIKDVARRARVAISTVSTVLHGKPTTRISAPTQARIREAARKLGYRPDRSARSLRSRKTRIVGMIMNKLRWHDCLEFIFPIESFFKKREYDLIIGFSEGDPREERRHVSDMASGWVDGLILHPVYHKHLKAFEYYRSLKVPIVLIAGPTGTGMPCVTQNRPMGIILCMRHLHQLGRRHIGLALSDRSGFWVDERLRGYHLALQQLGLPFDENLLLFDDACTSSVDSFAVGYNLALKARALLPRLDAVICENDVDANGMICRLKELHIDVPRTLSVVGFSNLSTGLYNSIPLTTIDQRYEELTRAAAEMLWELLDAPSREGPAEPRTFMPEPRLVVRESCGAHLFASPTGVSAVPGTLHGA